MKKIILIVVFFVTISSGIFFLIYNQKEKKNSVKVSDNKLTMVIPRSVQEANFLFDFANDNGYFEKEALQVERVYAEQNTFQMFIAGGADVYSAGANSAVIAYMNGQEPRIIARLVGLYSTYALGRFPKDEISSVKRVGVASQTSELVPQAKDMLAQMGADLNLIEMISFPDDSPRFAAFERGDLDFVVLNSPSLMEKIDINKYHFFKYEDFEQSLPYDKFLITTDAAIQEKESQLQKLVFAYRKALLYIDGHPEEVRRYLIEKHSFSEDKAKKYYGSFELAHQEKNVIPEINKLSPLMEQVSADIKFKEKRALSGIIYEEFAKKEMAL